MNAERKRGLIEMHIDICSNLSLGMFHHSSDHMLEGRIRKRARVSIIQAATTCHERPWLDFISTPGRPRASSKVDIREIHKLCGWRRVRRRRDCNLLRIKLMNINHRPARFTSPRLNMHFVLEFHTLDRITIPFSPLFLSPFVSHRQFFPARIRIFLFPSLLLVRWCQSPGSLFELEEFMFPRHAPRSTNNHHRHFFLEPRWTTLIIAWDRITIVKNLSRGWQIGLNSLNRFEICNNLTSDQERYSSKLSIWYSTYIYNYYFNLD